MLVNIEDVRRLSDLLSDKRRVVITAHMSPDGDAMGAALGLKHILAENVFCNDDFSLTVIMPNAAPNFLMWLPGAEDIVVAENNTEKTAHLLQEAELICVLDYCESKRAGTILQPLLENTTKPVLMIDHHINPGTFAPMLSLSYPQAPATAFIVLELFNLLVEEGLLSRYVLSKDAATCLYTGLMTDTGNFAFNNANMPQLYRMVAQLLEAGIEKDKIYDNVYNQFSVDRLRFTGYCLYHKMRIFPKYNTALIALSSDELRRFNFQSGDAEGIVNMPLQIASVHYSVFMREDTDKIKISFRSQGDRPVNVYAHEIFNGGGHANAAGGDSTLSLQDTVKRFEDTFRKYFTK